MTLTSKSRCRRFQSTHPLRGATRIPYLSRRFPLISIHAPLAGCDGTMGKAFNLQQISIHAPLAGCDNRFRRNRICWKISIHAPLAGCDSKIAEIFTANLRKSYKISAKPNKERRCRVLGKGKAAAISGLARCEPPSRILNASGSHQTISAPSGS